MCVPPKTKPQIATWQRHGEVQGMCVPQKTKAQRAPKSQRQKKCLAGKNRGPALRVGVKFSLI